MRAYDPSLPLVSLDIPNTADASLRSTLADWFGNERLFLHYRGDQGEAPERFDLGPGHCVHGHFNRARGIGALDYYPDASQFVTFLREPFTRFVAQWRALQKQQSLGVAVPALDDSPTFADWFARRVDAMAKGEDPFSFLAQLPREVAADNPSSAFDKDYVAVGIAEDYLSSVQALATTLGFAPPVAMPYVNRPDDPTAEFSEWRKPHREAFALEYAVYEAGRARMLEGLAKHQVAYPSDL